MKVELELLSPKVFSDPAPLALLASLVADLLILISDLLMI